MKSAPILVALLFAAIPVIVSGSDVLTNHNNNARTGLVTDETVLTPGNLSGLRLLFQSPVDGQVYAQPLCVSSQLVYKNGLSQGRHDLVIVATENGSVYAFDAVNGTTYWGVSLLAPGYTAVQSSDPNISCGDLRPIISITATPVIDRHAGPNGRIFVVAMETDGQQHYDYKLHALDLATGQDALAPVTIAASVTGDGPATTFIAVYQRSRSALLLLDGIIYTAWASFCDNPPYSGWVIGYRESDLTQAAVFNDDPNGSPPSSFLPDGSGSGIWQAGLGPAADDQGNIYLATANGPFDETLSHGFPANDDYGDSALKLIHSKNQIKVADYFTPYNEKAQATHDGDLGAGGPVLLPKIVSASGIEYELMVLANKGGNVYVLDRNHLGKFNPTTNKIYQELPKALGGAGLSSAAFFRDSIYIGGAKSYLFRFQFDFSKPGKPLLTPAAHSSTSFGYPGCTPSISSDGRKHGIVWAYENGATNGILHAYDPLTLNELYNSGTQLGLGVKFAVPTIFSGRVYVGTSESLAAFGLQ